MTKHYSSSRFHATLGGGLALPRTGLLFRVLVSNGLVDDIGISSITLTTGTAADLMAASWAFPDTAAVHTADTAMGGGVFFDAAGVPIVRYGYEWYVLANSTCLWFGPDSIVLYSTSQAAEAARIIRYCGNFPIIQRGLLPASGTTFAGGIPQAKFNVNDQTLFYGAGTSIDGGSTIIVNIASRRCRQDGHLRGVKIGITNYVSPGTVKAKVFRQNGANYEFVAESDAVAITGNGIKTINFVTQPTCQQGDVLGVYATNTFKLGTTTTGDGYSQSLRYAAGDISATDTFASLLGNLALNAEFIISKPFLAVSGDSIAAGSNRGTSIFYGVYDGITGDLNAEIMHIMSGGIAADGVRFGNYQNHAKAGQTWAWVRSTGIISAIATGAKALHIHCGINDIIAGRSWEDVEADMTAIAALITTQTLFVDEILPQTNGDDTRAATIRAWNGYYAPWCTAHNAVLVSCHDTMGKIRASTGFLDDLQTDPDYDKDGLHLDTLGILRMGEVWRDAYYQHYGISI